MRFDDCESEKGVRICTLACGDHGTPYTIRIWAAYVSMETILAGRSDSRTQSVLVCRASTEYLGDTYTLVAFGAKTQQTSRWLHLGRRPKHRTDCICGEGPNCALVASGAEVKTSAEVQTSSEKGVLSAKDFRNLLSGYTGYAGRNYNIFIIKHRSGELISFQQYDDPFLSAFGL